MALYVGGSRVNTRPAGGGSAFGGSPRYFSGSGRSVVASGSGTRDSPYTRDKQAGAVTSTSVTVASPAPLAQAGESDQSESVPSIAPVTPSARAVDVPTALSLSPAAYARAVASGAYTADGRPTAEFIALRNRYPGVVPEQSVPVAAPNVFDFQREQVRGLIAGRRAGPSEFGGVIDTQRLVRVPRGERTSRVVEFDYAPTGERFTFGDLFRADNRISNVDAAKVFFRNPRYSPERQARVDRAAYNIGSLGGALPGAGDFVEGVVGVTTKYPLGVSVGAIGAAGGGSLLGAAAPAGLGGGFVTWAAGSQVSASQLAVNPRGVGQAAPFIVAGGAGFVSGQRSLLAPDVSYRVAPQLVPDRFTRTSSRVRVVRPTGAVDVRGNVDTGFGQFGGRFGYRTVRVSDDYVKTAMAGSRGDVSRPFLLRVTGSERPVVGSTQTSLGPLGLPMESGASRVAVRAPVIDYTPKVAVRNVDGSLSPERVAFAIGQARNPAVFDGLRQSTLVGFTRSVPRVVASRRLLLPGRRAQLSVPSAPTVLFRSGSTARPRFQPPVLRVAVDAVGRLPSRTLDKPVVGLGTPVLFGVGVGGRQSISAVLGNPARLGDGLDSYQLPMINTGLTPATTPITESITTPATSTIPTQRFFTPNQPINNPPTTPFTPSTNNPATSGLTTPFIPPPPKGISLPGGGLGNNNNRKRRDKRVSRAYTPSLTGINLGIKTTKSEKASLKIATSGLELRGL